MTTEELGTSLMCIAYVTRHEIAMKHANGCSTFFFCKTCSLLASGEDRCPFFLHFRKVNGFWSLDKTDPRYSVRMNCGFRLFPDFCAKKPFLKVYIQRWLVEVGKEIESVSSVDVNDMLTHCGMKSEHERNVRRLVTEMKHRSEAKVLESEQKAEDFIRYLNSKGHFAALLYTSGELVVPGNVQGTSMHSHTSVWKLKRQLTPVVVTERLNSLFSTLKYAHQSKSCPQIQWFPKGKFRMS